MGLGLAQRVAQLTGTRSTGHETDHRPLDHGLGGGDEPLVVVVETAALSDPREGEPCRHPSRSGHRGIRHSAPRCARPSCTLRSVVRRGARRASRRHATGRTTSRRSPTAGSPRGADATHNQCERRRAPRSPVRVLGGPGHRPLGATSTTGPCSEWSKEEEKHDGRPERHPCPPAATRS